MTTMWKRITAILLVMLALSISVMVAQDNAPHPTLWLRANDLPRLQDWARDDNPLWGQLVAITDEAVAAMDAGDLLNGDTGSNAYEEYPGENYSMLFAFMSLVSPNENQ